MGSHGQGRAGVAFGAQRFDVTVTQAAANVKPRTTARAAHDLRWPVNLGKRSHSADGEQCENTRRYQGVSIGGNDGPEDPWFLTEAALSVAEVLGGSVDRVRELTSTWYQAS